MKQEELLEKVEMLEDLAIKQNEALQMAKTIIDLKNQLIKVCEEEIELHERINKRARQALWIAFGWVMIRLTIDIVRLLL